MRTFLIDIHITELCLHFVGNKVADEGLILSR